MAMEEQRAHWKKLNEKSNEAFKRLQELHGQMLAEHQSVPGPSQAMLAELVVAQRAVLNARNEEEDYLEKVFG